MPLYYAYLTKLLYLPSLLCLLLSSMPTQSLVSTCMELICQVILPSVLPSLLPTVPSAVLMYSTYIIVSYAYLVCYDYIHLLCSTMQPALPTWSAMVCPTMPAQFLLPTWSSTTMLGLLCLRASPVTYALSYIYSLLCFGFVQHFRCSLMFSYAM